MKITKWVDIGQEIEVSVSVEDIRCALSEEFYEATKDKLGDGDNKREVLCALNSVATFLNALDQRYIDGMTFGQRLTIENYLRSAADRFKLSPEVL